MCLVSLCKIIGFLSEISELSRLWKRHPEKTYIQGSPIVRGTESLVKVFYILTSYVVPPNLIENDHNFMFFGYNV